jgi:hypothetical protein
MSSVYQFRSSLESGAAQPVWDHMLLERAVAARTLPPMINHRWLLATNIWSALVIAGLWCMAQEWWIAGFLLIAINYVITSKIDKDCCRRLAYCAAIDTEFGGWALRSTFVSAREVPFDRLLVVGEVNRFHLQQARDDLSRPLSQSAQSRVLGLTIVSQLAKGAAAIALLVLAFRSPGWVTIGIGGVIGAFVLLQTAARLLAVILPLIAGKRN